MLHVDEPWLELISSGKKTVEGRSGPDDKFRYMIDSVITLYNDTRSIKMILADVRHYSTLKDYLMVEGWKNVAPHLNSYDEVYDAYLDFGCDWSQGINALVLSPM